MKKEALLYKKLNNQSVQCFLCAHQCIIAEGKFGFCGVRQNIGGEFFTYAYGKVVASHIDPIEKKPLYHFLPGSTSFSIATIGCNFRCAFCQNWEISQQNFKGLTNKATQQSSLRAPKGRSNHVFEIAQPVPSLSWRLLRRLRLLAMTSEGSPSAPRNDNSQTEVLPEEIVQQALAHSCKSISYTYTEPTIFFEYALETAKLAKQKGLYNIFVTNGYMSKECLEIIRPYLDAANVDLKFFRDSSYRKVCSGSLQPVIDSIKLMHKLGIWVEITTLVVPGENDSQEELGDIAQFIASVDKNIPWHISRFHPDYKFTNHHATPEDTLIKAQELGLGAGLNYVYIGNVAGLSSDTFCPNCQKLLIKREIFDILEYNIKDNKCVYCNTIIPGIFNVK